MPEWSGPVSRTGNDIMTNQGNIPQDSPLLLCIGDSITQGDTGMGFMAERPWPQQIGEQLGVRTVNCGYCGASTDDYRSHAPWTTAKHMASAASIAIFGLGTNDIDLDHARTPSELSEVANRLAGIIEELTNLNNALGIFVLSVPEFASEPPIMPRFEPEALQDMNRAVHTLNGIYRELCGKHAWGYIDYATAFNQHRELYGNTIHPNQEGYDVIAKSIARKLQGNIPLIQKTPEGNGSILERLA